VSTGQNDQAPTSGQPPLSRVIGWIVDKTIEIAARRCYGTLVVKFAAGKPIHVTFEEKWKIDELPKANEAVIPKSP
jgi:hypothetical protein